MKRIILILTLLILCLQVQSQIRFGAKVVSDLKNELYPIRHVSFGPSIDVNVPVIDIGLTTSVMFSPRHLYHTEANRLDRSYEFFLIPLNFKWEVGFPLLGLYIAAGPYGLIPIGTKIKKELDILTQARSWIYGLNAEVGVTFLENYKVCLGYKVDAFASDLEAYYHKENSLYLSFFYRIL